MKTVLYDKNKISYTTPSPLSGGGGGVGWGEDCLTVFDSEERSSMGGGKEEKAFN